VERRAKQKTLNEKLFKQLNKINPNTLYTNGNGHLILVGPSCPSQECIQRHFVHGPYFDRQSLATVMTLNPNQRLLQG